MCGEITVSFRADMNSIARTLVPWWAAGRTAYPAVVCGLRMAASVCLALYVAFWLQLDNPFWAGASAAAVCQPTLGASLRKGWYRMLGTVVGAVAILVITGCFAQDRAAFFIAMALWGSFCATIATLLRNFATYGAALASTTAVIIGCDTLGAVGGPDGQTFILAVTRAGEICIGIVCAGLVLAATDFGGARRRLAVQLAALSADIQNGLTHTLRVADGPSDELRLVRRELIGRVVALDPAVDHACGESSELRYHASVLVRASEGLFDALVGWQALANHLARIPRRLAAEQTEQVKRLVPPGLSTALRSGYGEIFGPTPLELSQVARHAVRRLSSVSTTVPSLQLLLDQTAIALAGIANSLLGLALLVSEPRLPTLRSSRVHPYIADWLPSLLNGGRAFVTICAAEALWVATAWPSGATCIIWAAIAVVLFGPRSDLAYASTVGYCLGGTIAAMFAAVVKFSILPNFESFPYLCAILACFLVPVAGWGSKGRFPALFGVMPVGFIALVSPQNVMVYDTVAFYNGAVALIAGTAIAALAFLLIPPLSPTVRTRRLLGSTLRDLRSIASGHTPLQSMEWKRRSYARLAALPDSAGLLERAQMTAAVTAGTELIHLHRAARLIPLGPQLNLAFAAFAAGRCSGVVEALALVDRQLAALRPPGHHARRMVRARASILTLKELLSQHSAYFGTGVHQ
jgi:uncharacterized membrane protein YccC